MYAIANDTSFYLPLAETVLPRWHALHLQLQTLAKGKGATDAEELRLLRELEDEKIWLRVGEPGMSAYVERELGYDPKTGQERLRVARALRHLPEIEAALSRSDLSYSAVKELARVAELETERAWLAKALGKSVREIETMVSGRGPGDLPETPPKLENIQHVVHAKVSASTFAKGREARKVVQKELGHAIDEDTFYSMAYDALLTRAGSGPERARHQIAVTICESCRRGWQHGAGRAIEIPPDVIAVAECDAEQIGSLDAKTPERASQDVTPATRRLVLHRDGFRCRVPSCRSSRNLDLHHIRHQHHGGTHEPDNLLTLCAEHHKAHHEGKLTIERGADDDIHIARSKPIVDVRPTPSVITRVLEALIGMGFRKDEARKLVDEATAHVGDADASTLLREALRRT